MIRNIFACLVHESPECVMDLVRNLRHLDPTSEILLYNGGGVPKLLLNAQPLEQLGVTVHPNPKPMKWGKLHDFALDCMRFALANLPFDTLTIVDSDQLATRSGYSQHLDRVLAAHAKAGLFSNVHGVLPPHSQIAPVQAAFQEVNLWRPWLQRFPSGEDKFPHWSFWPSTVFTWDAARDLTHLFDTDPQLQDILRRTRLWATEEVILPTLVALLGYEIVTKPTSSDFVKYRAAFQLPDLERALQQEDVFWIHPVLRRFEDPLRTRLRNFHEHYETINALPAVPAAGKMDNLLLTLPILRRMREVEGWFEDEEGDLLIATLSHAVRQLPAGVSIVETGSFCGRATVILGHVAKSIQKQNVVYAIDPHDGRVGAMDQGLKAFGSTLERFRKTLFNNKLDAVVETIQGHPAEVPWRQPIGFLLIDGLHDYANVARDFHHFEEWIVPGGYVAFHDYASYFPAVQLFVNELLTRKRYQKVSLAKSLFVLRKTDAGAPDVDRARSGPAVVKRKPFVSCIMPTADRRPFIPQAIRCFLKQDYPDRELIIIDDGLDSVADLMPENESIRYVRLPDRRTMGAKHNWACQLARGEVIVHLDDDDWNASWRVSYQVAALERHSPRGLCGLSHVFFYEPVGEQAWEYNYPMTGRPWVYGATFCYHKRFWEEHRLPDMNEGADTVYVWNLETQNVLALEDHRFFVATVHAGNTSPKRTNGAGWQPRSPTDVQGLVDTEGWNFYRGMKSHLANQRR